MCAVTWKTTCRSQECATVKMDKDTDLQAQGKTELLQLPCSVRAEGFETLTAITTYSNIMPNLLFRREHFIYQKVSIEFIKVNLAFRACKRDCCHHHICRQQCSEGNSCTV